MISFWCFVYFYIFLIEFVQKMFFIFNPFVFTFLISQKGLGRAGPASCTSKGPVQHNRMQPPPKSQGLRLRGGRMGSFRCRWKAERNWVLGTKSKFNLIPNIFRTRWCKIWYFRLRLFGLTEFVFWNIWSTT